MFRICTLLMFMFTLPNRTHIHYSSYFFLPKKVCTGEGGTQLKERLSRGAPAEIVSEPLP